MTPQERADRAAQLKKGMNCCQAVALAFADTVALDEATLSRLASGFGLGMGTMEGSCGALVGAVLVAGLRTGGGGATTAAKAILNGFKSRCGAVTCRELKGVDTGRPLCSCESCVRNAVLAAEEVLQAL